MTLKEAVYDVREAVNALNIESNITDRHIIFLMNQYRATLIRQHITNNPGEYRNQLTQTLFMELELVDTSQFPEKYLTNLTMLATKKAVPNIVGQQMYKEMEVRTIARFGTEVEISHKERLYNVYYAPPEFIYGYRDTDGKLYLVGKSPLYKNLQRITVTAIFEDPEAIQEIHDLTTDLEVYPITSHLWVTTKDMVVQHLLKELGVPSDTTINANDDTMLNGNTEKS